MPTLREQATSPNPLSLGEGGQEVLFPSPTLAEGLGVWLAPEGWANQPITTEDLKPLLLGIKSSRKSKCCPLICRSSSGLP
jgi:hypothetical protein